MTPDPRDELAALDKTPRGWTRADTDAMLDAAWARTLELAAGRNPYTEQRPRSLYEGNWTPQEPT